MTHWQAGIFLSTNERLYAEAIGWIFDLGPTLVNSDIENVIEIWSRAPSGEYRQERGVESTEEKLFDLIDELRPQASLTFTIWLPDGSGAISSVAREDYATVLSINLSGLSERDRDLLSSILVWVSCRADDCRGMIVGWEVEDDSRDWFDLLGSADSTSNFSELALVVRELPEGVRVVKFGEAWKSI